MPERIAPEDVPSVDPRVVDAERRAVEEVRQDPDILDGPALQNPGEADFPPPLMSFAIGRVHDGIHRPISDEPAIQAHLVGAIGSGAVREQKRREPRSGIVHGRPFVLREADI